MGPFDIPASKGEVYGKCVQDILNDIVAKMEDSSHELRITLQDAITGLQIAARATGPAPNVMGN